MIRKNLYRFSFLFQAARNKKLNPLIDQLFSQDQLKKYLNNTLKTQSQSDIDHKRVVLSFMQIIGREWVPKSFVILMSSYVNKYNLSPLLNSSLITERILAGEKEITHILPELFLMLSQSKLPKNELMAFQNTLLSVLPQDLSSMNVEFLIGLLTQTLASRNALKPLVIKLCVGLESKVWKFDKYDILDFVEIYKYGKEVAKPEMNQLYIAFESRLIEVIHMFNYKEFVQMIQGLKFGKDLNEQLLKVLEKKALVEASNFPTKDIFTVLDFFRTFIRIDQNKLILQLLLEFGKQKLYKVIRKLDNSTLAALNNDLLLQDLLTLSIVSYESSFLNIYSLLPMQITEEAKGKLSDPIVEKRVLEQLRKANSTSCMSYLFISLEAQLLNEEIIGIIEEKIVNDKFFTSLHLEAFYKMAKSRYLPDLDKWTPRIEKFIETNKNQLSPDDMFHSLLSCIILILEGKTKFEETYLSLTKILLEKKTRLNIFQKLDLLRCGCFVPNIFTMPVADFLLEEISQASPNEIRLFELEDRFAKIILSLEALFSKNNMNPIIIKGYNYDSKKNEPNELHFNLPESLIPVWKKSEALYRTNFIKRKPLYQISLLEDNVINALIGFLRNKGLVLSGGHYVYGFEVDIAVVLDKKIILVEVNGKSHYYLNRKEDQTWRTKGKENFFKSTDVIYFSIGMKEWNEFRFKKREFIDLMFKKKKLLSDFMLDRKENETEETNINNLL